MNNPNAINLYVVELTYQPISERWQLIAEIHGIRYVAATTDVPAKLADALATFDLGMQLTWEQAPADILSTRNRRWGDIQYHPFGVYVGFWDPPVHIFDVAKKPGVAISVPFRHGSVVADMIATVRPWDKEGWREKTLPEAATKLAMHLRHLQSQIDQETAGAPAKLEKWQEGKAEHTKTQENALELGVQVLYSGEAAPAGFYHAVRAVDSVNVTKMEMHCVTAEYEGSLAGTTDALLSALSVIENHEKVTFGSLQDSFAKATTAVLIVGTGVDMAKLAPKLWYQNTDTESVTRSGIIGCFAEFVTLQSTRVKPDSLFIATQKSYYEWTIIPPEEASEEVPS